MDVALNSRDYVRTILDMINGDIYGKMILDEWVQDHYQPGVRRK